MPRTSAVASLSGGKGGLLGHGAASQPQGADERDAVGVDVAVQGGGVYELADGPVHEQEAPDLLLHAVGGLGAQHDLGTALVGFELVQGGLELPPLRIQLRQL